MMWSRPEEKASCKRTRRVLPFLAANALSSASKRGNAAGNGGVVHAISGKERLHGNSLITPECSPAL